MGFPEGLAKGFSRPAPAPSPTSVVIGEMLVPSLADVLRMLALGSSLLRNRSEVSIEGGIGEEALVAGNAMERLR
jgi:hypothetical protein